MMDDLNDLNNTNETYNNNNDSNDNMTTNTNDNVIIRPDSSQIIELHVYIFPKQYWNNEQNMAYDFKIKGLMSLGFVRVSKDSNLNDLRKEIEKQCSKEDIPKEYSFLKNVGRAVTRVKHKQESEIKVKNYLSTQEIFLLDIINLAETPSDINITKNGSEDNEEDAFYTTPNPKNEITENNLPSIIRHSKLNLRQSSRSNFMNDPHLTSSKNHLDKIADGENHHHHIKKTARESKLVSKNLISEYDYEKLLEEQERLRLRQIELEKLRIQQLNNKISDPSAANISITNRGSVVQQENQQPGHINLTIYVKNDETNSNSGIKTINGGSSLGLNMMNSNIDNSNYLFDPFNPQNNVSFDGQQFSYRGLQNGVNRNLTQILRNPNQKYYSPNVDNIDLYSAEKNLSNKEYNKYILQKYPHLYDKNLSKNVAATRIQSYYRGYRDRKLLYQRYKDLYDLDLWELNMMKYENPTKYLNNKLEMIKNRRLRVESMKTDLIRHLKMIHSTLNKRRNESRDFWKKKFYNEKKKTPLVESHIQNLEQDLEQQQKKLVQFLETDIKNAASSGLKKESESKSTCLSVYKLHDEIFLLQRQIDQYKLKLATDLKLRNQAQLEIQMLRTELLHTKMNINQMKK